MLSELDKFFSASPEGLCLIDYAPTLSPTFLFIHFINNFSKKTFPVDASDQKQILFVSLHTTIDLLRTTMGKMAQRLEKDKFCFIPLSDFFDETLFSDYNKMFSQLEERIRSSILPDRPHLLIFDDLFLSHPALLPSKLLQFLLKVFSLLPAHSLLVASTGNALRLSNYIDSFFTYQIQLTPIGSGFGKNITGQMEIVERNLITDLMPRHLLFHYYCGQRSARMFSPGSQQILL